MVRPLTHITARLSVLLNKVPTERSPHGRKDHQRLPYMLGMSPIGTLGSMSSRALWCCHCGSKYRLLSTSLTQW
jgi:hypothetical protein